MESKDQIITYFNKHSIHIDILTKLRVILMNFPFQETIKWGMPTYVYDNKNLIGLGAFKNHVALWFFQGALLKDTHEILHNAQEGKTKAMRQIHFHSIDEINEGILKSYFEETIENQKRGLAVKIDRSAVKLVVPEELNVALASEKELSDAFYALSPGKQKDYAEYIRSAKREKTKTSRLEKILPLIRQHKGLYDKYKNC